VGPSTRPRKLGEQLVGCGFALYESLRVMSVSLARLRQPDYPEELVVRPVTNRRSLEEWLALWAEIWEIPASARPKLFEAFRRKGWTSDVVSYSGLLGGRLVALSTVFLGENAGVYNVATAPEARGKGVGSAMTHFALTEGRRRGLATGSLQSTKMGLHVYERLGFKELFKVDIYSLERR